MLVLSLEGCRQGWFAYPRDGFHFAAVDDRRCHQPDPAVMVGVAVAGKEDLAQAPRILNPNLEIERDRSDSQG
jgi:hypothetical protein